jgi:hypothetical protein
MAAVSVLERGSFAVVKLNETDEGDVFTILFVDPDKAKRPGYMWSDSGEMGEGDVVDELSRRGLSATSIVHLIRAARDHFSAAR